MSAASARAARTTFALTSADEVDLATRAVREIADAFGFGSLDANLIASATSELAMNAVLHAGGGEMRVEPAGNGRGLEITVTDDGPGIADIARACVSGFSTRSDGLGLGLAAAGRAMERFEIASVPDGGTSASIRHYLAPPAGQFDVGTVIDADPAYPCSGDVAFTRTAEGDKCLVAVIDGVGQGEPARAAALRAREALEDTASFEPLALAERAHEAVRGSGLRGFAMALLLAARDELRLVTVGDVACRVFGGRDGTETLRFVERPGVLGTDQPIRFVEQRRRLDADDLPVVAVLASDGVSPRFSATGRPIAGTATDIAHALLGDFRRARGDATVTVLRVEP